MRIFLVICFVFVGILGFGQATRSFTYGGLRDDVGNSIIEKEDSTFVIFGSTSSIDFDDKDFLCLKLNNELDLQDAFSFGTSGNDVLKKAILLPNNNYVLIGFSDFNTDFGFQGLLLVIDSNFNVLNEFIFGDEDWDTFEDVIFFNDKLVVLAKTYNKNNLRFKFDVILLDLNGNLILEKNIPIDNDGNIEPKKIIHSENGELLIVGTKEKESSFSGFFLNLDSNLNQQFLVIDDGSFETKYNSICETNDSAFLIGGGIKGANGNLDYYFRKINRFGIKIDEKVLPVTVWNSNDQVLSILQLDNGEFLYTGAGLNLDPNGPDFHVAKITSNLNFIEGRTFGAGEEDYPYDVIVTKDARMLTIGGTTSFGYGLEDVYLIELFEDFTPDEEPDYNYFLGNLANNRLSTSININQHQSKLDLITKHYFNQFETIIKDNYFDISIYSLNGQLIYNKTGLFESHIIETSSWSSGVYLIKCQTDIKVFNKKIVINPTH